MSKNAFVFRGRRRDLTCEADLGEWMGSAIDQLLREQEETPVTDADWLRSVATCMKAPEVQARLRNMADRLDATAHLLAACKEAEDVISEVGLIKGCAGTEKWVLDRIRAAIAQVQGGTS